MRLGQLARKVNVKPLQIISFLEKEHNIIVEDNLNSRIEEASLNLVLNKFKVVKPVKVIPIKKDVLISKLELENSKDEEAIILDEVLVEQQPLINNEPIGEVIEDLKVETIAINKFTITKITEDVETTNNVERLVAFDEDGEEVELRVVDGIIKAPKKELEGFKVVGKIDLPQKKKVITFITTNGDNTIDITDEILEKREELAKIKKEQYLERKKKRQNNPNTRKSVVRKVLSELEIKEKANKLAIEKQIQNSKVDKKLKKKHYQENIQPKSTVHKKRKKKTAQSSDVIKTVKGYDKEPTTKLGKLWKWFNS